MNPLSESQREDVRDLLALCRSFHADVVVIGAVAYQLLIDDDDRHTRDIDLALALDLDGFGRLETALTRRQWQRSERLEHRWTTPRGNRFDLLPAGPELRRARRVVWPRSQFVMSLAGFEHVFRRAVMCDIGAGLQVKVIPPAVLAILKVSAYMDDPSRRAKDLEDLQRLFRLYEDDSPRIFSDEVLAAGLRDLSFANAFLLGLDVAAIAEPGDLELLAAFLERIGVAAQATDEMPTLDDDLPSRREADLRQQLLAFSRGLSRPHR
jgi:predicted nucleotidyltransferase